MNEKKKKEKEKGGGEGIYTRGRMWGVSKFFRGWIVDTFCSNGMIADEPSLHCTGAGGFFSFLLSSVRIDRD